MGERSEPTNQEMYDALSHGIEVRWAYAVKHGELKKGSACLLCDVDNERIWWAEEKNEPYDSCSACPLGMNGMGCHLHTSPWREFDRAPTTAKAIKAAERMQKALIHLREKYFGDWEKKPHG